MTEPDYEAAADERAEERGQTWLHRMDLQYGTCSRAAGCTRPAKHPGPCMNAHDTTPLHQPQDEGAA